MSLKLTLNLWTAAEPRRLHILTHLQHTLDNILSRDFDRSLFDNNHYVVAIQLGLVAFDNRQNDSFSAIFYPFNAKLTAIPEFRRDATTMIITFLGTAAANAFPEAFCKCRNCAQARTLGGPSLRKRSAALINNDLL